MHYSQEILWTLFFIQQIIPNQAAKLCNQHSSRVNPEIFCSGFANLLHLDEILDQNIPKLSFSKNDITTINSLSFNASFSAVIELYLDNNVITNISDNAFKNLPNVQVIDLSNNKLEVLDLEAFSSNKELTTIDLTGNAIKSLDVKLIFKLDKLEKLVLSNNPLEVCDQTTATALRYLDEKKIKTFFLSTCEDPPVSPENEPNVTTKSVRIDDVPIAAAERYTGENFIFLTVILLLMIVVAFGLAYTIFCLSLKFINKTKAHSRGQSRTESEGYLLRKDNQRISRISGVDENGYMIPIVPQNPPIYLEVVGDSNQPLICLHSEVDLRNSKISSVEIPLPHTPTPVLKNQERIYQPNHVYEEIRQPATQDRNFYQWNVQTQPYACVNILPAK